MHQPIVFCSACTTVSSYKESSPSLSHLMSFLFAHTCIYVNKFSIAHIFHSLYKIENGEQT